MGIDLGAGGDVARRVWRDVYRKAAQAAEARLQALLAAHVYLFHRDMPAAGGGGGLVLVETQTMADATATAVHFTTVPAAGAGLLLVVSAHQLNAAGAGSLLLRLNDDATTNYTSAWHEVYGVPATGTKSHQALGGDSSYVPLGRLSIADADGFQDPTDSGAGIVALLPGHGVAGRRKQVLALGSAFTSITQHWFGQYGGEWRGTAAITKLSLIPSGGSATFGTGSVFTLYQLAHA